MTRREQWILLAAVVVAELAVPVVDEVEETVLMPDRTVARGGD